MSDKPPNTIYLQWSPDPDEGEITWCVDKIENDDIEYTRAELHHALIADLLAVCKVALADYETVNSHIELINAYYERNMPGSWMHPFTLTPRRLRVVIAQAQAKEEKDA